MPTIEEVKPVYSKFEGALFNFVKAPDADETTMQIAQNALKYLDDDQFFDLASYGEGSVPHAEQNLKIKLGPLVDFYRNIIPVLEQADNYLELTGLDGAPVLTIEVIEESPAIVVAVPPKAIPVLPTVTELLASFALGIAFVPISPDE